MKQLSTYRIQALDLWAATHSEKIDKSVYVIFNTKKRVDPERLKHAIQQSIKIVPEISSYYNSKKCILHGVDFTIEDIVIIHENEPDDSKEYWDINIFTGPLLQVHLFHQGEGTHVRFCMSHIICDGRGMVQYLELISKFYNNPELSVKKIPSNVRMDIYKLSKNLKGIKYYKVPEFEKYKSEIGDIKLPFEDNSDARYKLICIHIDANDIVHIRKKVKQKRATMNDLFMTAFLRALSCFKEQERYVIHCPLDMRKILQEEFEGKLTICNFTSKYICPAEIAPEDTFDKTLLAISEKMVMQKERMPRFAIDGIKFLFRWKWLFSDKFMAWMIRKRHTFYSVYYTNCGILEEEAISLHDNEIISAYITGSFLNPPAYQFSLTTFKGSTAITCNINGSPANLLLAEEILKEVKSQIMNWIN